MMGAICEVVDDGFTNSKGIALLGAGTSGYVELLDNGLDSLDSRCQTSYWTVGF